MNPLFTIGHSTHTMSVLLDLLKKHNIQAIADVRSQPFSARLPQFNRPALRFDLEQNGIRYVFLGKELGARRDESCCYVDGQARYDRIAQTTTFAEGLERVASGLSNYRICLLCAERDPLTCHRTILVARHLKQKGFEILHILADGALESHDDAERRLIRSLGMSQTSLFSPNDNPVERAYDEQSLRIAYRRIEGEPFNELPEEKPISTV